MFGTWNSIVWNGSAVIRASLSFGKIGAIFCSGTQTNLSHSYNFFTTIYLQKQSMFYSNIVQKQKYNMIQCTISWKFKQPKMFRGRMCQSDIHVSFVSSKDKRDFQPTAKCLVKQKPRLEGGHEWEPWQECYRRKNEHTHTSIVHSGKLPHRVP